MRSGAGNRGGLDGGGRFEGGGTDRAEAIARTITDENHQARALTNIAQIVAESGDTNRAIELADQPAWLVRRSGPRDKDLGAIAEIFARAGHTDRVEEIGRGMSQSDYASRALVKVAAVTISLR
jgi:hypothetical protein